MENKYEKLDWDSTFFGFHVYRINSPDLPEKELTEILRLLNNLQTELVYYSGKNKLNNPETISEFFEIKLVDKKTTYVKKINKNLIANKAITPYQKSYPENKLLELAMESGVYSRFKIDDKIPNEKFEELYRLWIINSVDKKLAKEVLVFMEGNEIAGFVTLGEKNTRADIGIIAVDSLFRGKKVGKSLMYAAEKWFNDKNYEEIQVVTQGENTPACRLYESCDYQIETVEYFYHMWKK